jgi:hypothetical protein
MSVYLFCDLSGEFSLMLLEGKGNELDNVSSIYVRQFSMLLITAVILA